jgi:hypothetical protein
LLQAYLVAVDIDENEIEETGVRIDRLIHSDLHLFFYKALKQACPIRLSPVG